MINKLYAQIKKTIKEYKFSFMLLIIVLIVLNFPLPYYIDTPGGAMDISTKVSLENAYKSKGTFNFAYVNELKATPSLYIISLFNKDWTLIKQENMKYDNETIEEMEFRNKISMEESHDNAIITSYNALGNKVNIQKEHIYITYIDKVSDTDLKIGDEIISVDGEKVNTRDELINKIRKYNENDIVNIEVIRDDKKISTKSKIIKEDGVSLIGAMLSTDKELETDPKIEILSEKNESGPSGGLMLSLSIYDALTKEDITKGLKIVGTGTIDEKGNVGSIGGVEYKLKGAVKEKADLFIVPNGDNYKEAMKIKKENNYDIKIKGVSTFDETLKYLNSL